ncbi:hypothetical protein [Hymenobacter cellulosilyticus]|uniref:DUF3575 domain-containing protein n=1 Tax=Hymenobacter cellulosilyticus TaxID=2932248 RepID=A0A8T9QAT5_9BACT|nr:hypothetical protein [Hymenobacter cellulosilyticus]UOQ72629.1 hypothetical protein MUN79_01115 [Hymenobacter cellulosilyticus]
MKTLTTILLAATMTSGTVLAQTKTPARAARPAGATTPAARTTTAKTTTTTKPAPKPSAKPSTPVASKPAPKPEPAAVPAPTPTPAPSATKSADQTAAGELFRKGTTMANLGVGLGLGYGYYGTFKSSPALSLSVEHGVLDGIGPGTIGVGGLVGYKSYHYDYPSTNYKATWTNIIVAARGTYHYNIFQNPKLDTYGA